MAGRLENSSSGVTCITTGSQIRNKFLNITESNHPVLWYFPSSLWKLIVVVIVPLSPSGCVLSQLHMLLVCRAVEKGLCDICVCVVQQLCGMPVQLVFLLLLLLLFFVCLFAFFAD